MWLTCVTKCSASKRLQARVPGHRRNIRTLRRGKRGSRCTRAARGRFELSSTSNAHLTLSRQCRRGRTLMRCARSFIHPESMHICQSSRVRLETRRSLLGVCRCTRSSKRRSGSARSACSPSLRFDHASFVWRSVLTYVHCSKSSGTGRWRRRSRSRRRLQRRRSTVISSSARRRCIAWQSHWCFQSTRAAARQPPA